MSKIFIIRELAAKSRIEIECAIKTRQCRIDGPSRNSLETNEGDHFGQDTEGRLRFPNRKQDRFD